MPPVKTEALHGFAQRQRDRVIRRLTRIDAVESIHPPAKAYMSEQRLAHQLANSRQLEIESVKRPQSLASRVRREKSAEKAVVVVAPHLLPRNRREPAPT